MASAAFWSVPNEPVIGKILAINDSKKKSVTRVAIIAIFEDHDYHLGRWCSFFVIFSFWYFETCSVARKNRAPALPGFF